VGPLAWNTTARRTLVIVGGYALYPAAVHLLSWLPLAKGQEGEYFFDLISIVFGTLTASTVSDASARLNRLREVVIQEATALSSLLVSLEAKLLSKEQIGQPLAAPSDAPADPHAGRAGDERQRHRERVFRECAGLLYDHSSTLISGTRAEELARIASREDALVRALGVAASAGHAADFAVPRIEEIIQTRACRISLENEKNGVPQLQYSVMRVNIYAIVFAFLYLTRSPTDALGAPDLLHLRGEDLAGLLVGSAFGARALFAYLCGALSIFYNLAIDFNRPFDGAFTLESETITATLKQLRERVRLYNGPC
jgi:hypothetical protein